MSLVNYIYLSVILHDRRRRRPTRRNAIIVFMGVELMLNAANLAFITFARMREPDGQVIALSRHGGRRRRVVVGLAIIMMIFRSRRSASIDNANLLKA